MIKRIAPIALVLVLGAVATGCSLNGGGKSATATASTTATGAAPWYAPYVDASLTMPKFPSRQVVLSFITGNGCTPTWNGTPLAQATAINTRIQQTQALSDQVIASFGGKTGPEPAVSCSDPTQLAASYQTVVSRYNLSTIDLDIEGSASLNSTVNARRAVAIATVQKAQAKAGRGLAVWLTLAVTPSGLLPDSLAVVQRDDVRRCDDLRRQRDDVRLRASGRPDGAQRQRERPDFHCSADPVSRAQLVVRAGRDDHGRPHRHRWSGVEPLRRPSVLELRIHTPSWTPVRVVAPPRPTMLRHPASTKQLLLWGDTTATAILEDPWQPDDTIAVVDFTHTERT